MTNYVVFQVRTGLLWQLIFPSPLTFLKKEKNSLTIFPAGLVLHWKPFDLWPLWWREHVCGCYRNRNRIDFCSSQQHIRVKVKALVALTEKHTVETIYTGVILWSAGKCYKCRAVLSPCLMRSMNQTLIFYPMFAQISAETYHLTLNTNDWVNRIIEKIPQILLYSWSSHQHVQ